MPPKVARARRWVFTLYQKGSGTDNPGNLVPDTQTLDSWETKVRGMDLGGIRYLIFQQEVCPDSGKDHIQGYIHFDKAVRVTQIAERFGTKPEAFTMARGTPEQNKDYCSKDDSRKQGKSTFEHGTCPGGQGNRSDLQQMTKKIKEKGLKRAIEDHPATYMKYPRGAEALDKHYKRARTEGVIRPNITVWVMWGTPSSGKSHWAMTYDPTSYYVLPDQSGSGTTWFDDYDGEKTLIIDDHEGRLIPLATMKRICDKYPMQVQTKGGYVPAEWTTVIITSNYHPQSWYPEDKDPWCIPGSIGVYPGPMQRRITYLFEFTAPRPATTIRWTDNPGGVMEDWPIGRALPRKDQLGQDPDVEVETPPTEVILQNQDEQEVHFTDEQISELLATPQEFIHARQRQQGDPETDEEEFDLGNDWDELDEQAAFEDALADALRAAERSGNHFIDDEAAED
jgi:hypothetical protein